MFRKRMAGHLYTLGPNLVNRVRPAAVPAWVPYSLDIHDDWMGGVRLTGEFGSVTPVLNGHGACRPLVIVIHGLGGRTDSQYCKKAAVAAASVGWDCLRLACRGADRRGEDFYHAGLTDDLHAVLADPTLAAYRLIYILGYSMGGHLALKAATEKLDQRVQAVAAISPPLDLEACQRAIDSPSRRVYRRHILSGLTEIYTEVARRRPVPTALSRIRRVETLYDWDALTVVRRFGFRSPKDYYQQMGVTHHIESISRPALIVSSHYDPMIPCESLNDTLARAPDHVESHLLDCGGHVGFPRRLDLGFGGSRGLAAQVMSWFSSCS